MPLPQSARLAVGASDSQAAREPTAIQPAAIGRTEVELTADRNFEQAARRPGFSTDQQWLLRTTFREVKLAEFLRGAMQASKAVPR